MEFRLTRSIVAVVLIVCCVSVAYADGDPTFNGILNSAACRYSTQAVCFPDGYCVPASVGPSVFAEFTFDLKNNLIYQPGVAFASQNQHLTITSISPATVGAPLNVKFEAKVSDQLLKVMILLRPNTNNFGNSLCLCRHNFSKHQASYST